MVIQIIDIGGIFTVKPKDQAPVGVDDDRMKAGPFALQWMQSPIPSIHVLRFARMFQRCKLKSQTACMLGTDAALIAGAEKFLQAFVPESLNHQLIVKRRLSRVNAVRLHWNVGKLEENRT
jgi:hypothetical protein